MAEFTNVKDVNVQPLFDTVLYAPGGSTLLNFFAVQLGQGVSSFQFGALVPKTIADTNMTLQGQLSNGFYFKMLGFRIMPSFDVTDADMHAIWNGGVFTFQKQAKVFIQVPMRTIPQGVGPSGSGASMNSVGWPVLGNAYSIKNKPIDIGPSENFNVTLTWPSGQTRAATTADGVNGGHLAGLPLTVFLDGFLYRPVQ